MPHLTPTLFVSPRLKPCRFAHQLQDLNLLILDFWSFLKLLHSCFCCFLCPSCLLKNLQYPDFTLSPSGGPLEVLSLQSIMRNRIPTSLHSQLSTTTVSYPYLVLLLKETSQNEFTCVISLYFTQTLLNPEAKTCNICACSLFIVNLYLYLASCI